MGRFNQQGWIFFEFILIMKFKIKNKRTVPNRHIHYTLGGYLYSTVWVLSCVVEYIKVLLWWIFHIKGKVKS